MNQRIGIIIAGIIAALISVSVAELIYGLTETIWFGRIITLAIAMVITGILYGLTYALIDARSSELDGVAGGVFAGAVGGILTWAIGESIFGPFALTGVLLTALVGGLIFSAQIDPKQI